MSSLSKEQSILSRETIENAFFPFFQNYAPFLTLTFLTFCNICFIIYYYILQSVLSVYLSVCVSIRLSVYKILVFVSACGGIKSHLVTGLVSSTAIGQPAYCPLCVCLSKCVNFFFKHLLL